MNGKVLAGAGIAGLWQVSGHWFPLAEPHKAPSVTRRLIAYAWGCFGIWLGVAVATDRETARKAAAITVSAGAATVGVYAIDKLLNAWVLRRAYGCHR